MNYSIDDIRRASVETLYDILGSCQSPGYYQMAVVPIRVKQGGTIGGVTEGVKQFV